MKRIRIGTVSTLILTCIPFAVVRAAGESDWTAKLRIELPGKAGTLAYSPDGDRIALGHTDGRVSIWNVKTGEMVRVLTAHTKEVNTVQFFPQGDRLITIGDDNRARIWSTIDWSEAAALEDVAFSGGVSPDGRWLAAQDAKQAIWLWDLSTLKRAEQLTEAGKGGTRNMSFTADGKYIATASSRPLLIRIDTKQNVSFVSSGDKKTTVKIEPQPGNQVAISMGPLQEDDAPTHRVIPSRAGSLVALGRAWYGRPAFVDVWDVSAMKRLGRYKPKDIGTLTSFSFDNSLLAIEGAEKVTIYKVGNGKQVTTVKGDGIMQFAPKSMELAVTDGNTLIIYVPK